MSRRPNSLSSLSLPHLQGLRLRKEDGRKRQVSLRDQVFIMFRISNLMTAQVLAGESLVRYRLWKVSQDRILILVIEKANFNAGCLIAVSITVNDYVIMATVAHAH